MAEATIREEVGHTRTESEARKGAKSGRQHRSEKAKSPDTAVITQDLHRLMESFTNEIKLAVPCDGISYRADEMEQHFVSGVLDHFLCCFEIKVGQKSLGNIYFARATRFLDSELSILENMVAGLVLPLCHLFQAEIPNGNMRGSDDNEQIPESATVHNQQV